MRQRKWLSLLLVMVLVLSGILSNTFVAFAAPAANEVAVSTVGELRNAVIDANANGGDTEIILENGTYNLDQTLYITSDNVTIRSRSGNYNDVTVRGSGMDGSVWHVFLIAANDFTVDGIAFGEVKYHAIQIQGEQGASNASVRNCRLYDANEQLLKVSGSSTVTETSANGLVENNLFEYTAGIGPQWYIGGVDAHHATNWTVRNNTFKHIRSPESRLAEHAVHFWSDSAGTLVENNIIIDCDRGIGFGLGNSGHQQGVIKNNFVHTTRDVGIGLENAYDTKVYNNTVFTENYFNSIEYRFAGTFGQIANNLTNEAIASREGGLGALNNNIDSATASWFVDATNGDLHLTSNATGVVDEGATLPEVSLDIDGQARPSGTAYDIGADEVEAITPPLNANMIIDHEHIGLNRIPSEWVSKAKEDLHIVYEHTSHGSQITTGMTGLVDFKGPMYAYNSGGRNGALDLRDRPSGAGDLGNSRWPEVTRTYLNSHPEANVVMWSWCGQVSSASEAYIDRYLENMNALEMEYPNVKFVYMTGHLDGSGLTGNLHIRNEQIRDYCEANDKILYDFADIETYNPDGVYFGDKIPNDACAYDTDGDGSRDGNWAIEWQNTHVKGVDWYEPVSAHSQPLNANMKAYAAWWLFARLAGWDGSTDPQPVDVTVNLEDTEGNPLADGLVVYSTGGDNQFIGKTDVNGTLTYTFDSTVTNVHMMVEYQGTMMEKTQNIKTEPVFDFVYEPQVQDVTVDVFLKDEAGEAIAGGTVYYYDGVNWLQLGRTGTDGKATRDFDGSLTEVQIRIQYETFIKELTQNIQEEPVYNFVYIPVPEDITVDVYVKDEAGEPVVGATIFYYDGSDWLQLGRTNAEGKADHVFDSTTTDLQIRAQYQTYLEEKTQNIQSQPGFNFVYQPLPQDIEVTVNLKDVDGNPLADGYVVYNDGGDNQFIGKTDVNGMVSHTFESTTSNVHMMVQYQGIMMEKTQDIQTAPVFDFVYEPAVQDTWVDVYLYNENQEPIAGGDVDYFDGVEWRPLGTTGQDGKASRNFDATISDLAIRVQYEGYSEEQTQDILGQPVYTFVYTAPIEDIDVDVQVKTNLGEPVEGAIVTYKENDQWVPFGTTDSTGVVTKAVDGNVNLLSIRVQYGTLDAVKSQYIAYEPTFQFVYQTDPSDGVTIRFIDSQGNPIEGGKVKYAKWSWTDLGLTDENGEIHAQIEPDTYKFRMNYGVGEQDIRMTIDNGSVVLFQTIDVNARLEASDGTGLEGGKVKFARYSWEDIGETDNNGDAHKEILPGTYKFRMNYGVGQQEIRQDITQNSTILFKTVDTQVKLQTSTGEGLEGGKVKFARYSWEDIGTTDENGVVNKELLPGAYKFRMNYGVGEQDIKQTITEDGEVVFETVGVTVKLEASDGSGLEGGKVRFARYSWEDIGETDGFGEVTKEILPGTYKFRMNYGVGQQDIRQDISKDSVVLFKTIDVKTRLVSSTGEGLEDAKVKYARYSWEDIGVTDDSGDVHKELLPGTYKFRMNYGVGQQDIRQNIEEDPTVLFQAVCAMIQVEDANGNGLEGAKVKYARYSWEDIGLTDENGCIDKDVLPGTYKFKVYYDNYSEYQTETVETCMTILFKAEEINQVVEEVSVEEPKVEEPKVEEPKVEEPKVEEPKVEEPKVEEPKVEEPKVEEPKVEEPKVEEPKVEEPKVKEPKVEEPKVEEPTVEEPKVEEPKVEEPKVEEPKVEESTVEEPKVEEPTVEELEVEETKITDMPV